jgi:uncharacterized protein YsxB (DUF464 family)
MIQVTTEDTKEGVRLSVLGHAEQTDEGPLVCAGTSALMMTLNAYLVPVEAYKDRDVDGCGDMVLDVPFHRLPQLEFVLMGLHLIACAYDGHFEFDLRDTCFKEPKQWNQLVEMSL